MSARWTRRNVYGRIAAWVVLAALTLALVGVSVSQGRAPSNGTLSVSERHVASGSIYIEGAFEFLTVRRNGASKPLVRKQFTLGKIRLVKRLPAGLYRIESWTQTCDGNCAYLDAPSGRCRRTVRVRASKTLRLTVVSAVGKACRLVG